MTAISLVLATCCLVACDNDDIDSDEEARRAYLALDVSIEKSIGLGFDGFNAASNANIPPQMTAGVEAGTLTITGQVDSGNSSNKEMRLRVGMVAYTDGEIVINEDGDTIVVVYDTDADPLLQPFLSMSLKNIPTGTFDGTLTGIYVMSGDLEGEADLNLTLTGTLQSDGAGGTERVPGNTHVTGTVLTPDDGSFTVDVTL